MRIVNLLIIAVISLSCVDNSRDGTVILAEVNGKVLTKTEALNSISPAAFSKDSTEVLKDFRDQWVREQLLIQEAIRMRIAQKDIVRQKIEQGRNEILINSLRDFIISEEQSDLSVSDEEVQQYYLANKNQFVLRERHVQYRHLVTATLQDAENAKRDLLRAVPWEEVVNEYSTQPQKNLDESRKFWPLSQAGAEISRLNTFLGLIGNMEISPIIRHESRYHFVQLTDSRAAGEHPDLEWLIEQIRDWLIVEKSRRYYNSYVQNLYLQATANNEIEITDVLGQ